MARVPYLTRETAPPEIAPLLAQLEDRRKPTPILRAVAHSRGAFRNFFRLAHSLLTYTVLPADLREMAILRVAAEDPAGYLWTHHEPIARECGVSEAQIAALRAGHAPPDLFDAPARAVIQFTDEAADRRLSEAAFAAVRDLLSAEAAVDLVLTIGWFAGMDPLVIAALGLETDLPAS